MQFKLSSILPFTTVLLFSWLLYSCAPKAASPPTPVITTPSPAATTPTSPSVPTLSPEDAAWARVEAEAKKEGKVSAYSFSLIGDSGSEVKRAFENTYGITLEITTGVGAVLMERIKSERAAAKPIADTYDTAPGFVITAKRLGLTRAAAKLPVLAERDVWRTTPHDTERHAFGLYLSQRPAQINTKLVRPGEEPKSYAELLDARWRGKIVIAPPFTDPSVIYLYVAGKKYGFLDDQYFRQLGKQNLKIVPTVRDVASTLARGEAALTPAFASSVVAGLIAEGAPIRSTGLAEGAILGWGVTMAILKDSPHPNAANVFLNWLLSQQGQEVYARAQKALPIRANLLFFGPEAAYVEPKKPLVLELADFDEVSRLQMAQAVDQLLGLAIK